MWHEPYKTEHWICGMSSQPDPIIQNIIDWCQEDNIRSVVDTTTNPRMIWAVNVGAGIIVYKQQQLLDRIYFQSQINFAEIHRTLVNQTWDVSQRNAMMFNLKKLAAQFDVLMNFQLTNDELTGFHTYKIHHDFTISKADFLEKFLRVQAVHDVILNQLNFELGHALQSSPNQNSGNANTGR